MKTKNFLSNQCGLSRASQCSDIGFDRRLTVGSPSGRYRSVVLRLCAVLAFVLAVGVRDAWGQTTTKYTFTSKSWGAKIGSTTANWTSTKDGCDFANSGIKCTTTESNNNAIGTSPVSFTNVTQVVVTYNTNKSAGAGNLKVKIGSNTEVSNAVAYSGSDDGRSANFTTTFNFSPGQSGYVQLTINTTTNSLYVVSIAITEAAVVPHTITFNEGTGSCGTSTSGSVTSYTLPSATPSSSCASEGWVFAGWKESSAQSETTDFPVLYAAGTTYAPASDITLYAVYYLPSTSYKKITNTNMLLKGSNYVIAYYYNSNYNALKNTTDGSGYIQTQTVSPSTDVVSSPAAAVVWELKGSAGAWQLYNANATKYMRVGTSPYVSTTSENIEISVSSNLFKFKNGSKYLIFYSDLTAGGSTTDDYNTYYVYRQQGKFNTNPSCAACDADPTIGDASINGSFF